MKVYANVLPSDFYIMQWYSCPLANRWFRPANKETRKVKFDQETGGVVTAIKMEPESTGPNSIFSAVNINFALTDDRLPVYNMDDY